MCKLRQVRWQFDFKNTELSKAVHLLAVLRVSPKDLSADELLRAVRTLTTATSGLLNTTQPENIEVSNNCYNEYSALELPATVLGRWRDGYSGRPAAAAR